MIEQPKEARLLAAGAHMAAGNLYSGKPYVTHLDEVVSILHEYGWNMAPFDQAGYLHDVLEDTLIDTDFLRLMGVSELVIRAVLFVTDEDGPNRKIRKARTYERVRESQEAGGFHVIVGLAVKWADRIANLRASHRDNPDKLKMYRREARPFRDAYTPRGRHLFDEMIREYNHLTKEDT